MGDAARSGYAALTVVTRVHDDTLENREQNSCNLGWSVGGRKGNGREAGRLGCGEAGSLGSWDAGRLGGWGGGRLYFTVFENSSFKSEIRKSNVKKIQLTDFALARATLNTKSESSIVRGEKYYYI